MLTLLILSMALVTGCAKPSIDQTTEPEPVLSQPSGTKQISSDQNNLPNPEVTLRKINNELEGWAENRWDFWDAMYDSNSDTIVVTISVEPSPPVPNELALRGYCDVIDDVVAKYAPTQKVDGFIYYKGELKKQCHDSSIIPPVPPY
jgi:hypothetical protein